MRAASGSGCESLWMLYQAAYRSYQNEVTGNGKRYDRYVTDFLNSHTYTSCVDASGMNEHRKNLGIMTDLLKSRKDLAEQFFSRQSFSHEDFIDMQHLLDTTEAPGPIPIGHPHPDGGSDDPCTFECMFTPSQMSLIVHCANEAHLFLGPVTESDMRALFDCNPDRPVKSANNRRVAVFFDSLCERNLICKQWQLVIARHRLILSSANNEPLKCGNLSSALNEAKASTKSIYDSIRKMIKDIADSREKDTNSIM